jgi:methylenetetrahydrofolate--tRNA-(uracil-5-)-methyltransferase
MNEVVVVGGGLAGCEAAFRVAEDGVPVRLYEMRPGMMTPAHRSGNLAELVCSSSLKSMSTETAHGLLTSEMRKLGSLVLRCAGEASVPGGDALCVDRERFSDLVTRAVSNHPLITIERREITEMPVDRPCVIATGPLTSPALSDSIARLTGASRLHFFDAIAPSVEADSIDHEKVFRQSRYDKGEAAYLNCPMTADEYHAFIDALLSAERADLHLDEDTNASYYEGCLPIEIMAGRGRETPAHGTMKPVGLTDPRTGRRPYAVVQLRQENTEGTVYGLVGFQTQLRHGEQARVFRMIPGLENAAFVRYGSVHRNTYIDSPHVLTTALTCKTDPLLLFAGQLTGVEGYMESTATGILAGINAARLVKDQPPITLPRETMLGALLDYVANGPADDFQPMASNFGILPELPFPHKKHERKGLKIARALESFLAFIESLKGLR